MAAGKRRDDTGRAQSHQEKELMYMQKLVAAVFVLAFGVWLYTATVAPVLEQANQQISQSLDAFTLGFPQ